jgi:hypothetical protein
VTLPNCSRGRVRWGLLQASQWDPVSRYGIFYNRRALTAGTRLGPYEINALIDSK